MDSRTIVLTDSAFKYGNLNIRKCGKNFFPSDCLGSNSKEVGTGNPIKIYAPGIKNSIKTDILPDRTSGRPCWLSC